MALHVNISLKSLSENHGTGPFGPVLFIHQIGKNTLPHVNDFLADDVVVESGLALGRE
jgi:hypothetical protein